MLHNEARELLVAGYEKTHDAQLIADAFSVSKRTVYRLVQQKRETGSVELRTSQRGRKPVLSEEDKTRI
ncbi:MAG: transcriptional regulator, partial [Oscillospiraceae bacterium]|nr:transcriptional regulator [Oscillospiraceae bacterium]